MSHDKFKEYMNRYNAEAAESNSSKKRGLEKSLRKKIFEGVDLQRAVTRERAVTVLGRLD